MTLRQHIAWTAFLSEMHGFWLALWIVALCTQRWAAATIAGGVVIWTFWLRRRVGRRLNMALGPWA